MQEIVVATANQGKLKEFKEILGNEYKLVSLKDINFNEDIVEDADTFLGNALIKARTISALTGKPVLADDSGLSVDALGGAPGVFSARYAGGHGSDESNRAKLLKEMEGKEVRTARFECALVLYYPNGEYLSSYGKTEGEILRQEVGDKGFGYDSLFYSYDLEKSFGLADASAKNEVSHRGRAIKELKNKLK